MKLRLLASTALLTVVLVIACALALSRHPSLVTAAPATGSVTGQVVWNAAIPVPYGGVAPSTPGQAEPGQVAPDQTAPDQVTPDATDVPPDTTQGAAPGAVVVPGMPIRPIPQPYPRLIPAGAVLVAIQGTNLSARTDDQGRFRIDNVPTGQYLMVAAGPVRNVTTAVAIRPNVYIQDGGGTVNLGRLYLGQSYYGGPVPYAGAAPDAGASAGVGTAEPGQTAPAEPGQ